jgi:hypothetical protein
MPALPQRHASIMLCHFPPNPGCFFFSLLHSRSQQLLHQTPHEDQQCNQSPIKQQKHKHQRYRQYMNIYRQKESWEKCPLHTKSYLEQSSRWDLFFLRRESKKGQKEQEVTWGRRKRGGDGEEKRREEIARELVGPMAVRSGGQWDAFAGL